MRLLDWAEVVMPGLVPREHILILCRANWCQEWWSEALVEGSPDACLSASEWTGIYYLSPLPTIKPVMSWFNSLGKQAYSSHVSINVNYPGSWSRLRVPQCCRPGLIAPAWNPICWMSMLYQMRDAVCVVWTIRAALPSLEFSIMKQALGRDIDAGSSEFTVNNTIDSAIVQCPIIVFCAGSSIRYFASDYINPGITGRMMNVNVENQKIIYWHWSREIKLLIKMPRDPLPYVDIKSGLHYINKPMLLTVITHSSTKES